MTNIKKIITILSFLLLFGCGYEPIHSIKKNEKNYNFSIQEINFLTPKNINKIVSNKLKNYINSENYTKKFILKIGINVNKSITSKNKQGNPEIFSVEINLNLEVLKNNISKSKINFKETFEYNNQSNKFDLKQYENNIQNNLLNKITDDIIKHLYLL